MKIINNTSLYAALLICALAACGHDDDASPPDTSGDEAGDASRQVLAVDFTAARSQRLAVPDRVARAQSVLLGGAADAMIAEDMRAPELAAGAGAAPEAALQRVRPNTRVSHQPETDDLLLVNSAVADDHAEGLDIGEAAARRIFEDTVARLSRAGLDDAGGLDLSRTKVSRLRQGSGERGRADTLRSHVKAYVFWAPRTVNGVEVMDSGMTIGVHRSGKLASIHSRGVLPGTVAAGRAAPRARVASTDQLEARAQSEFPGASIQRLGLMYAVTPQTDEKAARALEPREVFMVFAPLADGSGYSRGRKVAYSVTDARAPALPLDTMLQHDPGDARR